MKSEFDVLVVGVGVGGATTGFFLSSQNIDVLMVEKKKIVGSPVRCGEFIPTQESLKKMLPNSKYIEKIYSLIPEKVVSNKTKWIRFYSPSNKCFEFKFDGLVLKRNLLEQWIVEETLKRNIYLYTSSLVKSIKDRGKFSLVLVEGSQFSGVVKTGIVVGADGFPSKIAEWYGLKTGYGLGDVAFAVQKVLTGVDVEKDVVEMFSGNNYAPKGYAWIIPKGDDTANVGLGIRLNHFKVAHKISVVEYLNHFIKKHPIASKRLSKAKTLNFTAKLVPVGGIIDETHKNNVVLVGDAAGLVLAVNGSGIPTAMISGCIAGELIAEHVKGNLDLNVYSNLLKQEIGKVLGRSVTFRKVADIFMGSDKLFDFILKIVGVKGVSKVLKCESLF